MPDLDVDGVEVLMGSATPDLDWVVTASGDDESLMTMLSVFRGGHQVAGAGFGGRGLYPGAVMNEWRGKTDDLPYFVMACTAPDIDRVVATTDRRTEVVLRLSPVVERFGFRFAAAALPAGEGPGQIRAEIAGRAQQSLPQATGRPPELER